MTLERHSRGASRDQIVEMELEVTAIDLKNMRNMQVGAEELTRLALRKYYNLNLHAAATWKIDQIPVGTRLKYRYFNGNLSHDDSHASVSFLQYLGLFEIDGMLRDEFGLSPLELPLVYLPVNRSANVQSRVDLVNYNYGETKRQSDATSSRSHTPIVQLAVGRMAYSYRMLLDKDQGETAKKFREDPNMKELTRWLKDLGYEWELETINAIRNQYDVRLSKQGTSFLVGAASSGERELLTYVFAIFALNVRDALIVVDEPELHLHPKWQRKILRLFIELAKTTGNVFLFSTHSPTFISPESIQYVSRVFSQDQQSHILRLDASKLPQAKHLLNIVNSQNNERLFFADQVLLVEGVSDRVFFEAVLDLFGRATARLTLEVISVGGKGYFDRYEQVLRACQIDHFVLADRDYVEQVGTPQIKELFKLDANEIKTDVIDNVKSVDGATLVAAIEVAVAGGSWAGAQEIWTYIKSRRRALKTVLGPVEHAEFKGFLKAKADERIFILSEGALEAYLPAGHKKKDLEALLELLELPDFWSQLPLPQRVEIEEIACSVMGREKHLAATPRLATN
jgi:putative ATP-dependent endonuclease of the OLD family